MSSQADILSRFSGEGRGEPFFLPDLTLWYDWHSRRDTLPRRWKGASLVEICGSLGVPVWLAVRPWKIETPGVSVVATEQAGERVIHFATPKGELTARWTAGPGGDWWQTEYPVKAAADLPVALEVAQARTYVLEPGRYLEAAAAAGSDGVVAIEIPRRPFSDILHDFLGWSEGLALLGEPAVSSMMSVLEEKLVRLTAEVALLPGAVVLSPDNLDGQYISPRTFQRQLAGGYRLASETLHAQGKRLVVHAGGPLRHLLAPLAATGIDAVEGVAGPPQSNAALAEARQLTGPRLVLWGGIPQDYLSSTHDRPAFEEAVRQAAREVYGDPCAILGVADRVPVDAEVERIEAIPALIRETR